MVFHATNSQPKGGFFAVDVFFALSGYLIAGLLIAESRAWGSIDLANFYVRRARRLLPGLVLAIVGITLICPRVLDSIAVATMKGDAISTVFYYANWHFIDTGQSYFAQFGDASPYRQMWTLAIEEQFYFVLPALMIALLAITRGNRRLIAGALCGLAVLSAIWMWLLYTPGTDPSRVYYGSDTRAQDLFLGSTLAVVVSLLPMKRLREYASRFTALGVVALVAMFVFFFGVGEYADFTYRGGFFVFVLATCALITSVEVQQNGPVARLLGYRPWSWIGKISYGLYLWHWPIFVMLTPGRTGLSGPVLFVVRFALSFAAGAASYYLVEQPIRMRGLKNVLGRSGSLITGFIILPLTAVATIVFTPSVSANPLLTAKSGSEQQTAATNASAAMRVLIVGDSVGFSIGYAFPQASYPNVSVAGDVIIGCGTAEQHLVVNGVPQPQSSSDTSCDNVFGKWAADVKANRANVVIWSLGGWDVYDHVIDGKIVKEESPQYAAYFRSRLEMGLQQLGPNVQVVIPNVPCYHYTSYVVDGQDMAPDRNDPARAAALNKILAGFAAAHPRQVHIFDVAADVCPGGKYVNSLDGVKQVRMDGVHYTVQGAALFWKWIMPTLERVTGDSATARPASAAPSTPPVSPTTSSR
ncbi:peptidoglycan/LPS O-acetylase OafA/YrhL [Rudaeicoccus suwonensis]|uniref:Peptidoglycan/LPS O-acetylase OafA/YrhL n=2 Tax=Rudaeicoccus suwonensis TaxID=657409 RepID=A0A561DWW5_9MICO|nr:peptidoglycan/LPS O-acetylase OafA/YrhL [Rudaeicoccus suwonensis]